MEAAAFFKIGYGLYVVTTRDGEKDNGMICNTIVQVTNTPARLAVTINKQNFTHDTIKKTGLLNINVLDESASFAIFQRFGFKSGRDSDKFEGFEFSRGENNLAVLSSCVNAVFELRESSYIDLGTHGMFICDVTAAKVVSDKPTMTYAYYQANVKPNPLAGLQKAAGEKKKWVCKICGYVYDPEENDGVAFEDLPSDWVCPWCKHPKSDFEPIG